MYYIFYFQIVHHPNGDHTHEHTFPVFLEQLSSTLPSNFVFGFLLQPPICPNYVAFIFTHLPLLY